MTVLGVFAIPALLIIIGVARIVFDHRAAAARAAALEAEKAAQAAAKAESRRRAAATRAAAQEERRKAAAVREAEQQRKRAEKAAAREIMEAAQEEKRQKKLEAARELAELNERALKAARELKALEAGRPIPEAKPEARPAVHQQRPETISKPRPFAGHVVAFTGRLQCMRRAEAIQKVTAAGGRAYSKEFPSFTSILVVGAAPGKQKLDKYKILSGKVKKITEEQFIDMLKGA